MVAWSVERRVIAFVFSFHAIVAMAAVAMCGAGELYLMLNQLDPAQAGITSIIEYWRLNAGEPQQRQLLRSAVLMSAGAVLAMLLVPVVAEFVPWRRIRVAARFASAAEVRRAGLFDDEDGPSFIVGKCKGDYLLLHGQQSVMLCAPSRSGKGVAMVIPNLLCWRDSVVVLDISGQNFDVTAGHRAQSQPVFSFSPFDENGRSHCWNPLSAVRDNPEDRAADLLEIAEAIFPSVGQESCEAFFNERARHLFVGLGLMLFESPELPRTIGEMLRKVSGAGPRPFMDLFRYARLRKVSDKPLSGECSRAILSALLKSNGTVAAIAATFHEALSVFGKTTVDAATSGDDFRLEDVRRQRMSIYVRIPACHLDSAKPLLNLFFSQLVTLNTRLAPAQDPAVKYPCLLVNDEFAAIGKVDAIASKAAVLGDYNMRLLTVVRSVSQLDDVYGRQEARRFAANHAARIFYVPHTWDDAREYSDMVGDRKQWAMSPGWARSASRYFHSFFFPDGGEQRRPLLHPQEFKELGDQKLVLITQNCRPVLAGKIRYQSDAGLQMRLRRPPVVPSLDMRRHMLRVQRRVRDLDVPVRVGNPAVGTPSTPLARDLAGLAGRLEKSLKKSPGEAEDVEMDRRVAYDKSWTRD